MITAKAVFAISSIGAVHNAAATAV